ncbi:MAG: hypothetical protein ABIO45_05550 [Burkholderiaceae bacterium]
MSSTPSTPRRLHIDRLVLDLRGIDPAIAQAAARALGPALAEAMATQEIGAHAPLQHLDAGRLRSMAAPSAGALATQMAQRIAGQLGGGGTQP